MTRFVLRRIVVLVIQVFLVTVAFFLLLRVLPADPAAKYAGLGGTASIKQARAQLGLNLSVATQLWKYLSGLAHGSLGVSWDSGTSVVTDIVQRFPVDLTLVVLAFTVAILVAIPVGRAAAAKPGGRVDRATLLYSLVAGAQPDFFWGLVLVFVFAVKIHVFPVPTGQLSPTTIAPPVVTHFLLIDSLLAGNFTAFWDAIVHLVLPVFTLAFVLTGPLVKMTRESVLAVHMADYVVYARASGLPERQVRRIMLRNAVAPVLTLVGILFAFMLGGAVLVEYVFSLNGLGLYALNATLSLDYPSVQGSVIVLTTASLIIFLLLDVAQSIADPRVRLGERS
jgi:ABC-type dipeptide/oligopeptide/nickel transport system permease component